MLVVTVDRLPAWMLASYGATWVSTPAIDALAARGVAFDRVIVPITSPPGGSAPLSICESLFAAGEGLPLLAAAAARDWRPCVVTDDPRVPGPVLPGMSDAVEVRLEPPEPAGDVAADDRSTAIARLVDVAVGRITGGSRFVWCHVSSLGVTWDAPDAHRQRYIDPDDPQPPPGAAVAALVVDESTDPDRLVGARQVFAGQLTLLDGQLARLFAAVRERERADGGGWAVLLVGVRGLPLGLHGLVGVGEDELPYGEVVHVPAILVDPAGRMAAQRHGMLVTPADLGCTLAELIGEPAGTPAVPAEPWRGESLLGLFRDWSARVRDRVIVVGPSAAAVITPQWHCVAIAATGDAPRRIRLYAKPDDFFEQVDVADRCAEVAATLGALAISAQAGDMTRAWNDPLPGERPG